MLDLLDDECLLLLDDSVLVDGVLLDCPVFVDGHVFVDGPVYGWVLVVGILIIAGDVDLGLWLLEANVNEGDVINVNTTLIPTKDSSVLNIHPSLTILHMF